MNKEFFNTVFDLSAHHPAFMDDADNYDPKPIKFDVMPITPPTGEIFELKTVHISRMVSNKAIHLLRAFQSQLGPSKPEDEDAAETWDEIEEICEKLGGNDYA